MQNNHAEKVREAYATGSPYADYNLLSRLESRLGSNDENLGAFARELMTARMDGQRERRAQILGVYDD